MDGGDSDIPGQDDGAAARSPLPSYDPETASANGLESAGGSDLGSTDSGSDSGDEEKTYSAAELAALRKELHRADRFGAVGALAGKFDGALQNSSDTAVVPAQGPDESPVKLVETVTCAQYTPHTTIRQRRPILLPPAQTVRAQTQDGPARDGMG
jgi:hypothetical protein